MAHRHVASLFLPSSSSIARRVSPYANPLVRSIAPARPRSSQGARVRICPIHHCSRTRFKQASTSIDSSSNSNGRNGIDGTRDSAAGRLGSVDGGQRGKEEPNRVWGLPPPPPTITSGSSSAPSSSGGTEDRGLPIPDNVDVTSALASGHLPSENMDEQTGRGTESFPPTDKAHTTVEGESTPNYPTLPYSDDPESIAPKLSTPNITSSPEFPSNEVSSASTSSVASSGSSPSTQANTRPFDLSTLTSKFTQASKHLTIPPEAQARLAAWGTAVLGHTKRVAKDSEKRLVELGLKVNQMTGYQEVERLKALVFAKEDNLQTLRDSARTAKASYDEAVASRSSAQRDVNTLLERKHSWTDADVVRFTSLVRADHSSTHAVASTSVQLKEAELSVDKAFSELMQTILQRYHEEQVWSDKIRSVSTWANLIGLALNAVIFLGAVVIVEPWKRKRLVERLEERVAGMMERVEGRLGGMEGYLKELPSSQAGTAAAGVAASITAENHQHRERQAAHATVEDLKDVTPTSSTPPASDFLFDETTPPTSASPLSSDAFDEKPLPSDQHIPELANQGPVISRPHIPLVKQTIHGLPEYMDVVANPSHERDMALAGMAGAALMGCAMTLGRWVFS